MNREILKSTFHDSYDGMLLDEEDSATTNWTYIRDTREAIINTIPNKILLLQQGWNNSLKKSDERTLNMNMLILGLYPHLIFIPIKWKRIEDPITKTINYKYSLTDFNDYFKVIEILGSTKNYWNGKSRKEVNKKLMEKLHISDEAAEECFYNFYLHRGTGEGNHVFYPEKLVNAGIEYSDRFNAFFIEFGKTFKEKDINSPIFVTDLSFKYAIVNPRLSGFRVNRGRDIEGHWSDVVTFNIPDTILDKVIMSIPLKIADFYTSSKEDCIPEPSNDTKIESHGFDKKYSFRPNMKNRPK